MTLSARTAVPADLPFIRAVTDAAYAEYAAILDRPPLPVAEDYVPRVAAGEVLVVSRDGAEIAAVTVESHPDHLMIFSLAVMPGHQGGGVGRWMLDHVEARARAAGKAEVRLYTNGKMTRNIAVYARAGYRETGREDNPKRPGWVAVHMAKPV